MKNIIFAFALRFYVLLIVTVIISLLSGQGSLAILGGIFSAIGAILWVVPKENKQVLGVKNLTILLAAFVFLTLPYPLFVMYLIYYSKGVVSIAIPLILYFVSSFVLVVLFIMKIRRRKIIGSDAN